MSQENVEIATRWYEAATSKHQLLAAMPGTMALCHPKVEWTVPEDGTTYRGREGVSQRLKEWLESSMTTDTRSSGSSTAEAMRYWSRQPRWAAASEWRRG